MNENRQSATVCFLNDDSSLTTKGDRYFKFFVLSKLKMVSTLHYSKVSTQPLWFLNFAGELSQCVYHTSIVTENAFYSKIIDIKKGTTQKSRRFYI